MEQSKLNEILRLHELWHSGDPNGVRAVLRWADLERADLTGAYLEEADLGDAYLRGADLERANLTGANLTGASLREADLRGAVLDYSCLPLWCGSIGMKIDKRLAVQFVYHAIVNMDSKIMQEFLKDPIAFANQFHRIKSRDCEPIKKEM